MTELNKTNKTSYSNTTHTTHTYALHAHIFINTGPHKNTQIKKNI